MFPGLDDYSKRAINAADHSGYRPLNQSRKCIAPASLSLSSSYHHLAIMALSMRPFHANHAPYEDRHDDPLAKVLQPPPDESPADRARREQAKDQDEDEGG